MRDVHATTIPPCDLRNLLASREHGPGVYNTPTRRDDAETDGRWANLCEECFARHGIDTSVTERRVVPPAEVLAIARRWAGANARLAPTASGAWRATEMFEDGRAGYIYDVYPPGTPYPVLEDSGRPCGVDSRDEWVVRCLNDAPDAWWTVSLDGIYRGHAGEARVW